MSDDESEFKKRPSTYRRNKISPPSKIPKPPGSSKTSRFHIPKIPIVKKPIQSEPESVPSKLKPIQSPSHPKSPVSPPVVKPFTPIRKRPMTNDISLFIAVIALLVSFATLYMVMVSPSAGLSHEDKTLLLSLASDIRGIKNEAVTMTAPATATLHLSGTIPVADVFSKGGQKIVIPVDININKTLIGVDARTGVPMKIQLNDVIKTNATIDVDFTTSEAVLNVDNDIPISTVTTGTLSLDDLSDRLNLIASKIEKLAD
ncbi:hypothetical protein J7J26_02635 [Candidatus Micrarchaeota archaeon]|nr:hypothetical protein [Candidatus Micrarchaeota archaeon]